MDQGVWAGLGFASAAVAVTVLAPNSQRVRVVLSAVFWLLAAEFLILASTTRPGVRAVTTFCLLAIGGAAVLLRRRSARNTSREPSPEPTDLPTVLDQAIALTNGAIDTVLFGASFPDAKGDAVEVADWEMEVEIALYNYGHTAIAQFRDRSWITPRPAPAHVAADPQLLSMWNAMDRGLRRLELMRSDI